MKIIISIFIVLVLCGGVVAQITTDESIRISILTCAPGDQLYSIYGHNAIRITDRQAGTDKVYNYGTFDFNTPGFAIKFMRGKLPYILSVADYYDFLSEYEYFKRSVTEQELFLDPLQKQKIVQYLNENIRPENRAYKYDFFMDNCATRLRDIIDKNVSGFKWDTGKSSGKTFRDIIKEYQQGLPWTDFGIDLIIGSPADRKTTLSEEAFIPDYLSAAIEQARYQDPRQTSLQFRKTDILKFKMPKESNLFFLTPLFIFGILLMFEINIFFRVLRGQYDRWIPKYDTFWMVVIAMSSVLMLFMWWGTDHIPTRNNWNVLWANPLFLVWFFCRESMFKIKKALFLLLAFCLVISFVNAIPVIQFLPQYFNPVIMIISVILLLKTYRLSFIIIDNANQQIAP